MTRDQPVDDKKYEKRDEECLYRLPDHNDRGGVEKPAIDPVVGGFDHENAEQLLGAVICIEYPEFAPRGVGSTDGSRR